MSNDAARLSRRDWFRLRVPRDQPTAEGCEVRSASLESVMLDASASSCLTPISPPENHAGIDLSTLPPMREAELSMDQVAALFADIEALATDIQLLRRDQGTQATATLPELPEQLAAAHAALNTGSVQRLQIRYAWQGMRWIDTLEVRSTAIRLVRIGHVPD